MNTIWNNNGVMVSGITQNHFEGMQMRTVGIGWFTNEVGVAREFEWQGIATNRGWHIAIFTSGGRVGEIQGLTYNLPLEVASIARRLL